MLCHTTSIFRQIAQIEHFSYAYFRVLFLACDGRRRGDPNVYGTWNHKYSLDLDCLITLYHRCQAILIVAMFYHGDSADIVLIFIKSFSANQNKIFDIKYSNLIYIRKSNLPWKPRINLQLTFLGVKSCILKKSSNGVKRHILKIYSEPINQVEQKSGLELQKRQG